LPLAGVRKSAAPTVDGADLLTLPGRSVVVVPARDLDGFREGLESWRAAATERGRKVVWVAAVPADDGVEVRAAEAGDDRRWLLASEPALAGGALASLLPRIAPHDVLVVHGLALGAAVRGTVLIVITGGAPVAAWVPRARALKDRADLVVEALSPQMVGAFLDTLCAS